MKSVHPQAIRAIRWVVSGEISSPSARHLREPRPWYTGPVEPNTQNERKNPHESGIDHRRNR